MDRDRALRALTLTMRAGEVMLASSVAVSDVDAALRRTTAALGLAHCQVSVTLDVITLSYLSPDVGAPLTLVSSVDTGETRLDRLVAVEQICRRIEAGELDVDTAYAALLEVEDAPPTYRPLTRAGATLLSVVAWVVFAGGAAGAALAGAVAWVIVTPVLRLVARTRVPDVFGVFVASLVVVAVPYGLDGLGLPLRVPAAVAGGLYPLLPGGLLVASVVDGLSGAPISSLAKGLQAVVTAGAIALGVVAMVAATQSLDLHPAEPAERWPAVVTAAAAAVAVGALAVSRSAPPRTVAGTAAIGLGVWLLAWYGAQTDVGRMAATFAAAVALGAAGQLLARAQRTTATLYSSVAVYVLVPGIVLYVGVYAVAVGAGDLGRELVEQAVRVAAAIAAGVALGVAVAAAVPSPRSRIRLWRGGVRS